MSVLDRITLPKTEQKTRGRTGGVLGRLKIPEDRARAKEVFDISVGAFEAKEEEVEASKISTIARETGLDLFSRFKEAGVDAATGVFETFKETPRKVAEDIKAGAEDIQEGDTIKGIIKSGGRVAGDVATAIFAPIGAMIGATLQLTGGQDLIDKAGNVIADKSGITDMKAFQEFAVSHPNAGEDFERIAVLLMGKFEKGQIRPKAFSREINSFVKKIIPKETPSVVTEAAVRAPAEGSVFERVTEAPTVPGEPRVPVTPRAPTTGTKVSRVAESIESKAIEKGLTEGFDGVAGFDPITIKGQAIKVAEMIEKDMGRVKRIVAGTEPLPDGVRASSIILAVEKFVESGKGDVSLLRDLANSPLTSETSIFAQELRILRERVPNSPVKIMQDIKKVREEAFTKRTKTTIKQATKTEVAKVKKSIKESRSGRQGWEEFIISIRCK